MDEPPVSASAVPQLLRFPGGLLPKRRWHLSAWPVPRRAAALAWGRLLAFPLAVKLGSGERALSAAWDGGGSGSRGSCECSGLYF